MKKTFYLFAFLPLIISCSNGELKHTEALEILQQEYLNSCEQEIVEHYLSTNKNYNVIYNNAMSLRDEGYVTLKERHKQANHYTGAWTDLDIYPTEKGKSFLVRKGSYSRGAKYKIATAKVIDVIGISHNENEATVKFSYTYEPTPLYTIRASLDINRNNIKECASGSLEGQVVFKKFDSGWKMEQPKTEEQKLLELYQ